MPLKIAAATIGGISLVSWAVVEVLPWQTDGAVYLGIIILLGWLVWSLLLTPPIRRAVTITGVRTATKLVIACGALIAAGSLIGLGIRQGIADQPLSLIFNFPMASALLPYLLLLGLVAGTNRYATAAALLVSVGSLVGLNAWAATELIRWTLPGNKVGGLVVFAFVPQLLAMLGILVPTKVVSSILCRGESDSDPPRGLVELPVPGLGGK